MAIGPIAWHGLYDEHQKAGDPREKTDLGQAQPHFVHKNGKQGAHERAVEITAEVHQAKGDENSPIGFWSRIGHRGFWHLPRLKSMGKVRVFYVRNPAHLDLDELEQVLHSRPWKRVLDSVGKFCLLKWTPCFLNHNGNLKKLTPSLKGSIICLISVKTKVILD